MGLSSGTRLGPYEILAPLGEGGMGEVYRARDVRLDRIVAVKVLPERLSGDPDALARFEREAKAVAALSHPNILSLHDVGADRGISYAVTELLEGETLRERLRDGPLPPARAIGFGAQIAEGLAAAHAKGLIHRDLKPENLFITREGRVKILDFGVAKRTASGLVHADAPTEAMATEPGVILGTAAYMSPEQVRGKALDARSDIFSFGAVLYEMLAGSRPFQGRSQADTMAAILTKEPPPLADRLGDLPPSLERIVARCLAKEPEERYDSARDLAADLGVLADRRSGGESLPTAVTVVPPAARPRRLRRALLMAVPVLLGAAAVFVWLGRPRRGPLVRAAGLGPRDRRPERDRRSGVRPVALHGADGEPRAVRARERLSPLSCRGGPHADEEGPGRADRSRAGPGDLREESIRALVTCAIARAGTRYSLAARIVDARTGESVRAFEEQARGEDDVLPALSTLAARIRQSLGESLPAIQRANRPLPMVTTASLRALQQYAEGQLLWTKGKYPEAVKMYETAVQEDPGFAMAHAALGNAYMSHIFNRPSKGREHYAKALELSSRTTDRERLLIQASSAGAGGDTAESMRLYRVYLEAYPDDTRVRYTLGTTLMQNKRSAEALEQFKEVIRIAPNSASALVNMATTLNQLQRFPEALDFYAKAFALEPEWEARDNLNHEYWLHARSRRPAGQGTRSLREGRCDDGLPCEGSCGRSRFSTSTKGAIATPLPGFGRRFSRTRRPATR